MRHVKRAALALAMLTFLVVVFQPGAGAAIRSGLAFAAGNVAGNLSALAGYVAHINVSAYITGGAWSPINLLLAIAGMVLAIQLLLGLPGTARRRPFCAKAKAWRFLAIAAGLLCGVLAVVNEDLSRGMALANRWTLLMLTIFVFELMSVLYLRKALRNHQPPGIPALAET